MVILLTLFILAYIAFTIYAFYDLLFNHSLVTFIWSLVGYIILIYSINKATKDKKEKIKDCNDFEVTHEETSIDDLFYEEHSYTEDSHKEECLIDESMEFDVYLDKNIGKQTEWQKAFFENYDKRKR